MAEPQSFRSVDRSLSLHETLREPVSHKAAVEAEADAAKAAEQSKHETPSGHFTAVEYKRAERRTKALRNAAHHLVLGEELSKRAADHRVIEGAPFEAEAVVRAIHYAHKHELGNIFTPDSDPTRRLQEFEAEATRIARLSNLAEPQLPPVEMIK